MSEDKYDEMAHEVARRNGAQYATRLVKDIASALRQVAQEKERETLERAAKVCRERAAKHRETSEKAAFHTLAWVDGRALEATCCANEILRLSPTAPSEGKHQWDGDGERCLKCGDKDWFAGPVCKGKAIPTPTEDVPTPTELADGYVRVPRDGWEQDGNLLYRLKDESNYDEISVSQAKGSRRMEDRERLATALLAMIQAAEKGE